MKQQEDGRETSFPDAGFSLRLSGTPRGARLARTLAVQHVAEWCGGPYDTEAVRAVALVTAELASNAITHGRLPGRDFRLTLRLRTRSVRIEVTDTRPERLPPVPPAGPRCPEADSGRGLLLVEAYADRWGCSALDAWTKTVWAEVRLS